MSDHVIANVSWDEIAAAAAVIKAGIQYLNLTQDLKNRIDQYVGRFGGGFAVCSTAADTAAKTAALQDGGTFELCRGGLVTVLFNNAVPQNATLNINSTGARQIWFQGSRIGDGVIGAGAYALFSYVEIGGTAVYDLITTDHLADKKLAEFGCCRRVASGSGTAFTVSVDDFRLTHGGYQMLLFQSDVGTGATLNISNTGALPIWFRGEQIKSGTIRSGDRVMLVYVSGSNERYDLMTVDRANSVPEAADYGLGYGYAVQVPGADTAFTCDVVVGASGTFLPRPGVPFVVEFNSAAPAGSTLNVSQTGDFPLYFRGAVLIDGVIQAGCRVQLIRATADRYHVLSVDRGVILAGMQAERTSSMMAKVGYDRRSGRLFAETGLLDEAKNVLLSLLAKAVYVSNDAQNDYDELERSLFPPGVVLAIAAEFVQGSTIVYDTDSLDDLRSMLTVTATYDDGSTATVTGYTLSGPLTEGTSTITVTYYGKTDTFTVNVSHSYVPTGYRQCEYIENCGGAYIVTGITVGSTTLKISTKYYRASQVSAEEAIAAGNIGAGSAGFEIGLSSTTNRLFAFSSSSAEIVDALVYGNANDLEAVFKPSSPYASMKLTNGGTELTATKTSANNSSLASAKLNIFHTGDGNANFKGRIYGLSLHKDEDTAVFIGYPCYRLSDNVAGLYDTVSETFFPSNGSSQFTKGADV